jgi:hypothetical protein
MDRIPLTAKLSGRPEAPNRRRGRTLSFGARGAYPPTPHGPLQRLLDLTPNTSTERAFKMHLGEPQYREYETPNAEPEHSDNHLAKSKVPL